MKWAWRRGRIRRVKGRIRRRKKERKEVVVRRRRVRVVTFVYHHGKFSEFRNSMQTLNTSKYPVDISQMRTKWNYVSCSVLERAIGATSVCSP